MHDVKGVHVLEPAHDVPEKVDGLALRQFSALLEVVPEVALFAKLSDDVHVVAGLVHVQQSHDVLVLQFLHYLDLAVNVLQVVLVREDSLVDDLDSRWRVVAQQTTEVDAGVRALAEQLRQREDVFLDFLLALREVLATL